MGILLLHVRSFNPWRNIRKSMNMSSKTGSVEFNEIAEGDDVELILSMNISSVVTELVEGACDASVLLTDGLRVEGAPEMSELSTVGFGDDGPGLVCRTVGVLLPFILEGRDDRFGPGLPLRMVGLGVNVGPVLPTDN